MDFEASEEFDWFCIEGSANSWRAWRSRQSNDKTKIPLFRKKSFPKSCLKGGGGGGGGGEKGSFQSQAFETHEEEHRMSWREEKRKRRWKYWWEWEEIITSILWFSVWRRGGEVGIIAPVPPQYCESTLIDKATWWRGPSCWQDLRRLFTEELVWSGALIALLYGKDLSFDVSLFLQFPSYSYFLPKRMLPLIVCLTLIHLNLRRQCGAKTTETVSNWRTGLI